MRIRTACVFLSPWELCFAACYSLRHAVVSEPEEWLQQWQLHYVMQEGSAGLRGCLAPICRRLSWSYGKGQPGPLQIHRKPLCESSPARLWRWEEERAGHFSVCQGCTHQILAGQHLLRRCLAVFPHHSGSHAEECACVPPPAFSAPQQDWRLPREKIRKFLGFIQDC